MPSTMPHRPIYPSFEKSYFYTPRGKAPYKYILMGITLPNPRFNIKREVPLDEHAKRINIIEYILEGEGDILVDEKWIPARAGDVFIIRSSQKQFYKTNPKKPWKKIFFNYYSKYLDLFLDECGIESGVYSNTGTLRYFETALEIAKKQAGSYDDNYTITECIHKIIHSVSATLTRELGSVEFSIREELDSSIYEKVDLDQIAEKLHLSKSNLIRIFKKCYSITPYDYLINAKIETAKMLLRNTQLTSKEIAKKLCFSNEHYFSSLFFSRVGVRPRAFRTAAK